MAESKVFAVSCSRLSPNAHVEPEFMRKRASKRGWRSVISKKLSACSAPPREKDPDSPRGVRGIAAWLLAPSAPRLRHCADTQAARCIFSKKRCISRL